MCLGDKSGYVIPLLKYCLPNLLHITSKLLIAHKAMPHLTLTSLCHLPSSTLSQ